MGDADEQKLIRASDNPWYWMATLHGEQKSPPTAMLMDEELATRNRVAWNRWIATGLTEDERATCILRGVLESDLAPFTNAEAQEVKRLFAERRSNAKTNAPDPGQAADFSGLVFEQAVSFSGFLFVYRANFSSATFCDVARFTSALFLGYANFSSAVFSGSVTFASGVFLNETNFGSVEFRAQTEFASTMFSAEAVFKLSSFSGHVNFRAVEFLNDANFGATTYSEHTNFESAAFSRAAYFVSAVFSQGASFNSCKFHNVANWQSATFADRANFGSAAFLDRSNFLNVVFRAWTNFAAARFEISVPDFRGAIMHEATEWHGITWPKPPTNAEMAQKQVYRYERLKQEMERLKKHEDEQYFFRKELRAKRGLSVPLSPEWLLNYAYEALSDYGQSLARPMVGLLVLWVTGRIIFANATHFHGIKMKVSAAAVLSFVNILPFLPERASIISSNSIGALSNWEHIVSAFQSLVGAVLLFLLLLPLRNRFRMR